MVKRRNIMGDREEERRQDTKMNKMIRYKISNDLYKATLLYDGVQCVLEILYQSDATKEKPDFEV